MHSVKHINNENNLPPELNFLKPVLERIIPLDEAAGERAAAYIDTLTKPQGSLGRLEQLAVDLAKMTGEPFPSVTPPAILVMAGDHGIVKEGVSAYPQEVTRQMVLNFLSGGAAINVFARQIGAAVEIVDVGVAADVEAEGLQRRKIRYGTGNFLVEDAMTREEAIEAVQVGIETAEQAINDGARLIIIGEMGIGNTTSSSAVLSVITGKAKQSEGKDVDWDAIVGAGTGISNEAINHKKSVIKKAVAARNPDPADPVDILAKVGGLEIGAMAGAVLGAAARRVPVLVDGFISTVAALLAVEVCDAARDYLIAGHRSQEPGHHIALELLNKQPLLDLGMRLGEGSGAALAFPIVEAAARMVREMATFNSAGVSQKERG